MRLLVALLLVSCTSMSMALRPGRELLGPREISVINGNNGEQALLERALFARGIRLIVPKGDRIPTRYTIDLSGSCNLTGLRIEIYDRAAEDVAFVAHRSSSPFGCPDSIYDELAAELDRLWKSQPAAANL